MTGVVSFCAIQIPNGSICGLSWTSTGSGSFAVRCSASAKVYHCKKNSAGDSSRQNYMDLARRDPLY